MKFCTLLFALVPLVANADLKWEATKKSVTFKPETGVYRVDFPFRNTGKMSINVESIQTGCACCTKAKLKEKVYAPGESGSLTVMVDVRGKSVPSAHAVLVQYTDKQTPTAIVLEIKTADGKKISIPRWNIGFRK